MSAGQTQQALVLIEKDKPLDLQTVPIPEAVPGSAIVKVLATSIAPGTRRMFSGKAPIPHVLPLIPSSSAVGRIHALGNGATLLKEGQLVFVDLLVRARDDPDASILLGYIGGFDAGSAKLMEGEWRNGTYAEYAKMPLENVYALNEELLINFVAAGGLLEINVHAGDSVIVAPSTGYFGGAAVHVALAMGARVVAAGRNEPVLAKMAETFKSTGRLTTVKLTGDVEADTAALKKASGSSKGADAYVDWSPPQAGQSTHILACLSALRPFGRSGFGGGIFGNVEIPYFVVMKNSLRIQGRYMFDREHALQVIKLLECGLLKFGSGDASGIKVQAGFKLKDSEKLLTAAETASGWGNLVVLEP